MPEHVSGQAGTERNSGAVAVADIECGKPHVTVAAVDRRDAQFAIPLLDGPPELRGARIRRKEKHRDRIAYDQVNHSVVLKLLIG